MEQNAKNIIIDLRRCNNAFVTNIQSKATGVTKRVICIPVEDNFIDEAGYVDRNGNQIRTAKMQVKMWPVSEESKQQYDKKQDYDLRLDISKNAREALEQRDPQLAARLRYNDSAYDRELSKQLLPYVGQAYDMQATQLPPEQTATVSMEQAEGDDDLPF
jgi:hypothetical protein